MIQLRLPTPPSVNRYWRTTRRGRAPYLSEEAKAYKVAVQRVARSCGLPGPLEGTLAIECLWTREAKRGDLDNRIKVFLDSLQGIAYADDNQIVRILAMRRDKSPEHPPGLDVMVYAVEPNW